MDGVIEERNVFEIGVVVPKRTVKEGQTINTVDETFDCVEVLVDEFKKTGLVVERIVGIADEFIKVLLLSL